MMRRRPVVIANEIRMRRSQHQGPFLVVEGRDDRLFMEQFTSPGSCKVVVAEGKQSVCEVIDILENDDFKGALGLIDSDFDRVEGGEATSPNIVKPEFHDLETMLICSPALDRVLSEVGSQDKLERFGKDVLEELIARALPVAHLRLYSVRNGLNLRFRGLKYSAWIDPVSFEAKVSSLIEEVKNHSQRLDMASEALAVGIREVETADLEPREICNGQDLIEVLSVGLRRVLGTNDASSVNGDKLRRYLRLAFSIQDFAASSLSREIRRWEAENDGFPLLRK